MNEKVSQHFSHQLIKVKQNDTPVEEDEDEFSVVRTKRFDLKPMDEEEAILQMNMLGHNFFIFTDAESDETNIVYKRRDGKVWFN